MSTRILWIVIHVNKVLSQVWFPERLIVVRTCWSWWGRRWWSAWGSSRRSGPRPPRPRCSGARCTDRRASASWSTGSLTSVALCGETATQSTRLVSTKLCFFPLFRVFRNPIKDTHIQNQIHRGHDGYPILPIMSDDEGVFCYVECLFNYQVCLPSQVLFVFDYYNNPSWVVSMAVKLVPPPHFSGYCILHYGNNWCCNRNCAMF